jgi:hypothetical protein
MQPGLSIFLSVLGHFGLYLECAGPVSLVFIALCEQVIDFGWVVAG